MKIPNSTQLCLLLTLITINLFVHNVSSDQLFAAHTGGTFGRSSHEPNYNIEFHSTQTPFHPDDNHESLVMSDKSGQKFMCFLRKEEKTKTRRLVTQKNTTGLIVESEKQAKLKTPDELLEVFKNQCLYRLRTLMQQESWWSYEFCYQKKIRQFHLGDDKITMEFVLGVYDEEATVAFNKNLSAVSVLKDPRSKDASQRYHAHLYTNGTICELTNKPRETEVRFVCSDNKARITSVTELSTCKYAVTILSPTLCKHPMFQEQRPVFHTIHCNELPRDTKPKENKAGSSKDKQITMIAEVKDPSNYGSEKYAT